MTTTEESRVWYLLEKDVNGVIRYFKECDPYAVTVADAYDAKWYKNERDAKYAQELFGLLNYSIIEHRFAGDPDPED